MPIEILKSDIPKQTLRIQKILKPLSDKKYSIKARLAKDKRGTIAFAAYSGNEASLSSFFRSWNFKVSNTDFLCSYFERWSDTSSPLTLINAYFTLYENSDNSQKEVMSLHIDPLEKKIVYKAGPHIHIKSENYSISKAHIPVFLHHYNNIINSYSNFISAYSNAIMMISKEIINNKQ